MANKRILKKQIKYVCGDLAGECIMAIHFVEGIDIEQMQNIIFDIATLQTTSLKRVTFSFDKISSDYESRKEYSLARTKYFKQAYGALKLEFNNKVQEIVKAMNKQLPQAQKDANKRAVNK